MDARISNIIIATIGFYVFSSITSEPSFPCSRNCTGPLKYYEELGCSPIFDDPDDCCPTSFDCEIWTNLATEECLVDGYVYKMHEKLLQNQSNPCDDCVCHGNDGWVCAWPLCDSLPNIMRSILRTKHCYLTWNPTKCCPSYECVQNATDRVSCFVDGKEYKAGKSFRPAAEPEKLCYCSENYNNNSNIEPFCVTRKHSGCNNILHAVPLIRQNCVPVYEHDQSLLRDCSYGFRCQNRHDSVITWNSTTITLDNNTTTLDNTTVTTLDDTTITTLENTTITTLDNTIITTLDSTTITTLDNTPLTLDKTSSKLNNTTITLDNTTRTLDTTTITTLDTTTITTLDDTTITLDNTTTMLDNTTITLDNTTTMLDNTDITLDNNTTTLDNTTITTLDNTTITTFDTNTITTLDDTTTTLDNTTSMLDNTAITLDITTTMLDNTTITLDNTTITLDNTTTVLDNTTITLDNTTITLDNTTTMLDSTAITLDSTTITTLDNTTITLDNTTALLDNTTVTTLDDTTIIINNNTTLDNTIENYDKMCRFGDLKMKINDTLKENTSPSSKCVSCKCEVPPVPTCRRRAEKDCPP